MPKNANEKLALAGPNRKIFSAFQASLGQSTPRHFFVVVVDLTSPKLVRAAIN